MFFLLHTITALVNSIYLLIFLIEKLQGYGGYGGYNQPPPPQINPDVQNLFQSVDKDRSGRINAQELKACLVNGKGENFSDTACNLMIGNT